MHDGRFEIESEPDRGTVVTVILPANRRIDPKSAEAPATQPLRRQESPAA
jgi:signal transduction histidine kinase